MAPRGHGQYCGVATAVELVGERWAILVIRDLLVGARRYSDLKRGLPRVPTNILATRLKELQEAGVVRRVPIAKCGPAYELTEYGRALEPIILALGRWGFASMGEPSDGDVVTADSLTVALRAAFRPDSASDASYEVRVGETRLLVSVSAGRLTIADLGTAWVAEHDAQPQVVIVAGPRIREVIAGTLSPADALADGAVEVLEGEPGLLESFAATFRIDPPVAPAR